MEQCLPFPDYHCYKVDFLCHCGRTQRRKQERKVEHECRYWIEDFELGNCILRIDRPYGAKETAKRLGISHQALYSIEVKAKEKLASRLRQVWVEYNEPMIEFMR